MTPSSEQSKSQELANPNDFDVIRIWLTAGINATAFANSRPVAGNLEVADNARQMTVTRQTLQRNRQAILEIAQRHGAHDLRLFGSVARGESTESSDVDILVRFDLDRSLFDHGGLIADLEELLGAKVDVVSEAGMRERFRARFGRSSPVMRSDALRLQDILDAIAAIERHTPATREAFNNSEPIRSHILLHVQIIGEAASRLSPQIRIDNSQVPWKSIMAMRNIIAHVYFGIDWNEVWQVAVRDAPVLKLQVEKILASLPRGTP